jgi:hypothetical protein
VDNLVVYDWAFADDQAVQRRRTSALSPASKPKDPPMNVWLWGGFPDLGEVGVNARNHPNYNEIKMFQIRLYERLQGGRRQVAMAEVGAQAGVCVAPLLYRPVKQMESASSLAMDGGGAGGTAADELDLDGLGGGGELGDMMDDLTTTMDLGKPYAIVVKPLPDECGVPAYTLHVTAGENKVDRHRW